MRVLTFVFLLVWCAAARADALGDSVKAAEKAYRQSVRATAATLPPAEARAHVRNNLNNDAMLALRSRVTWDWLESAEPGDTARLDKFVAYVHGDNIIARAGDRVDQTVTTDRRVPLKSRPDILVTVERSTARVRAETHRKFKVIGLPKAIVPGREEGTFLEEHRYVPIDTSGWVATIRDGNVIELKRKEHK